MVGKSWGDQEAAGKFSPNRQNQGWVSCTSELAAHTRARHYVTRLQLGSVVLSVTGLQLDRLRASSMTTCRIALKPLRHLAVESLI